MAELLDAAPALRASWASLNAEEQATATMLLEAKQEHLFSAWPPAGEAEADKKRLLAQAADLDRSLRGTGGLASYVARARELLADSKANKNPFEGYTPSVPEGETLSYGTPAFCETESLGMAEVPFAAFVLVAGGLGERLGYSGIKLALPTESATGASYLQLYCESLLALQARTGCGPLPLALMTSGDTHARTEAMLREHAYFGLEPSQVTLMMQEKVPCLADNDARMALDGKDGFSLQTKPHGHGDVHALLHSTGLAAAWLAAGRKWVVFFQDTNALVFKAIPAALGASARAGFDVNSLCVPRKAKEAIGGIAKLTREDGSSMTVNVEYNQLDPLLRASGWADGDSNDAETGYSPFPGNINQLIFALPAYAAQLGASGGGVAEFVNPKYSDGSKSAFKSPTRLECMMQDYAKTVPAGTRVGFTTIREVWVGYSPVKNSVADALAKVAAGCPPHSAAGGECDQYGAAARAMALAGAAVGGPQAVVFAGTPLSLYPRIVLAPSTACCFTQLRDQVLPQPARVCVSERSALLVSGAVVIAGLQLDGALRIVAAPGARVRVEGLTVRNRGWDWVPLGEGEEAAEEVRIRGFRVERHAAAEFTFSEPGEHVLSGTYEEA